MNADDIKPIAFVTGYMRGYPTIKALDKALVFNAGMALYSYEKVLKSVQAEREACAIQASELTEIGYDGRAIAIAIKARGK